MRQDWNLVMPATGTGIYIMVSGNGGLGTYQTQGSSIAGWDFNIQGTSRLDMFANTADPTVGNRTRFVRTQANGPPSSLAVGTVVGPSSPFASGATPPTNPLIDSSNVGFNGWTLNDTNYFGFRFYNETTSQVNYAFGALQVGATATSRTLLFLEYGNAGESVTVTAIPAPGVLALLGIAGLAGRRRVRRSPGPRRGAAWGPAAPSAHG